MKNTGLLIIALLVSGSAIAQDKLSVNTDESVINWHGEKIVGNSHDGTIMFKEGSIEVKNGKLVGGSFTADMTSIKEGKGAAKLDGHLKSDDFFGVETYPTSSLVITKVAKGKDGAAQITANLTIKGKTEEITFPALFSIENGVAIASAELTFDRSKFDVRYGSGSFFDDLGNKAISDEIKINVSLKAN
ncbi:MAG: YceI family protein [Cyclobacteriaceae bacterium]